MRRLGSFLWAWSFLLLILICGCGPKQGPFPIRPGKTLAVAPITCPSLPWEVISGCLLKGASRPSPSQLKKLDAYLMKQLTSSCDLHVLSLHITRQCMEILTRREEANISNPILFWSKIGACIPADYILVPQLLEFREREGGDWGVFVPARVVLSMSLIDVHKRSLVSSYIFEEEQRPLMENLLSIKKFLRRRGRWVKAIELAEEGINQCLRGLHLCKEKRPFKGGALP